MISLWLMLLLVPLVSASCVDQGSVDECVASCDCMWCEETVMCVDIGADCPGGHFDGNPCHDRSHKHGSDIVTVMILGMVLGIVVCCVLWCTVAACCGWCCK